MFLRPPSESLPTHRRGAGVGLSALAAVGLFRGGVAFRVSDSCGVRGILGGCHVEAQANAAHIRRLSDYQKVLTQFVTEISTNTDENFLLVQNALPALFSLRAQMASNLGIYARTIQYV